EVFRTRTRSCRRLAQQFHRLARKKGADAIAAMKRAYERQLAVTRASLRQAKRVVAILAAATPVAARRLREEFEHFLPLVEQAVQQAFRRVIMGEAGPAPGENGRLFEPATQSHNRAKNGEARGVRRQRGVRRGGGGGGWRRGGGGGGMVGGGAPLKEGGGPAQPYRGAALARHRARFASPPHLLAGDRGISSPDNERLARDAGIKRVVFPWVGRA